MLSGLSSSTLFWTADGIPPTKALKFTVSKPICRRKFRRKFSQRVVRPWHRLHRGAVVAHPWRPSRPRWMGPWAA